MSSTATQATGSLNDVVWAGAIDPKRVGSVVFIDPGVPEIGSLLEGVRADHLAVVLDRNTDGLRQIAETLTAHGLRDLAAIHIVSHGTPGQIHIGATLLNARALADHAALLADIGAALAPGGGILLYGCNVARGPAGRHFAEELSVYTGANVAAASHKVGAAARGGSWELDVATGPIAAGLAFSKEAIADYRGVLTLSIGDATTTEGDAGTKTLTFTVTLSAPAPAGGVTFDIQTADNTATTADGDYVQKILLAQTIPVGETTYTFDVVVNGDTTVEPDQTFFVNVTNVSGDTLGDGQGIGTIENDDNTPPTLTATGNSPTFVENGAAIDLFNTVAASAVEAGQNLDQLVLTVTNVAGSGATESLTIDGTIVVLTNLNSQTTATNGMTASVALSGGTATVTISKVGGISSALMQTLVDDLAYDNTSEDPGAANRVVTLTSLRDTGTNGGGAENISTLSIASTVTVTPVNDEPTLIATPTSPTFVEGAAAADLFSAVTASTVEAGQSLTSLTLTVTNVTDGANEILFFDGSDVALTSGNSVTTATNGLTVNVTVAAGTATVTFSGASLSAAQVQTLVDGLTYRNTTEDPTDANRVVTITQLVDSGANGGINADDNTSAPNLVSTVNVDPVNDEPTLTATPTSPTFTENGAAVLLFNTAAASAIEAGQNLDQLVLTVTNVAGTGATESLTIDGTIVVLTNLNSQTTATNGMTASVALSGGTATVTISKVGGISSALMQTLVDDLAYDNSSEDPGAANRVVTLTSLRDTGANGGANNDDNISTLSIASTVTVTPVNDEPTLTATPTNPIFAEGAAAVDLFNTVTVSTIEAGQTITSLTLTVTNVTDGANEILSFDGSNVALTNGNAVTTATNNLNVTVTVAAGTATVTFSGASLTTAQVQTLVDGLTYSNTSQDPTDANRVVTITQLVDSGANGGSDDNTSNPGVASTVNVNPVNDEPTLTATPTSPTFTENGAAVDLFNTVSASPIEAGQNLDQLILTVTNVAGTGATESLTIDGTIVVLTNLNSQTTATNGMTASVALSGGTATVTISKVGGISSTLMQTLVDNLAYDNTSEDPGAVNRVVTLTSLRDTGPGGAPDDNISTLSIASTVTVTPVNDEPTLTATGSSPTFVENGAAIDLFNTVAASTIEAGQNLDQLVLTVTNVAGTGATESLTIDGTIVVLTNLNSQTTATNGMTASVALSGGTATVTISKVGGISSALMQTLVDNLAYDNTSEDPGAANRVVTLTSLRDTGPGGAPDDNISTLSIASTVTVTPVNDEPTLTATGSSPTFVENGAAIDLFNTVAASTVEAGQNLDQLVLTVTNVAGSGATESLTIDGTIVVLTNLNSQTTATNGMTASVALSGGTATVTISKAGGISSALMQTLVDNLAYDNTSEDPGAANRVVTLTSLRDTGANGGANNDDNISTLSIVSTVTVTPVNDEPTLTATGLSPTFTEAAGVGTQAAAVTVFSAANANTIEAGQTIIGLTFTVGGLHDGANEKLVVDGTAITLGANSSGTTLTNSMSYSVAIAGGVATIALTKPAGVSTPNINTLINTITYQDTKTDAPYAGDRTFTLTQVQDSGGTLNGGDDTKTLAIPSVVHVVAVNDGPVNAVPGGTLAVTEDTPFAITGANTISVTDIDAAPQNVSVTLSVLHGTLDVNTAIVGGVDAAHVAGDTTGSVTLLGTPAQIDTTLAAANGLVYQGNLNYSGSDTLTVNTSDLGHTGTGGVMTDLGDTVAINVSAAAPSNTLSATQTTTLAIDNDGDGVIDPGDHVTVTVQIANNSAATAATGVSFNETLTGLTQNGAVHITPIAFNDSYTGVASNTPIHLSVLANDIDPNSSTPLSNVGLTISSVDTTGTSGTVTIDAGNTTVTFTPTTGFSGITSFKYFTHDSSDNLNSNEAATVTVNVNGGKIWYVDSAANPVGADGSFDHPFLSLAPLTTGGSADAADGAGDTIFVYSSAGAPLTYDGGIVLEASQKLIGDGVAFTVNSGITGGSSLSVGHDGGANDAAHSPIITTSAAGANDITLASGNTVQGITLGNTGAGGTALFGNAFGTLTINNVAIATNNTAVDLTNGAFAAGASFSSVSVSTAGITDINLNNVSGTVDLGNGTMNGQFAVTGGLVSTTYGGNITQSGTGALVNVTGGHTGTLTFNTGTLTATNGTGLQFNNADGTYNFNGTNTLSNAVGGATANAGINIVNGSGGNFSFSSNSSIVNQNTGTAFNVDGGGGNITYAGTIGTTTLGTDNHGNTSVSITNKTGGTVALSGNILDSSDAGGGIGISGNANTTVNFTGAAKTLNTGIGDAVSMTGNTGTSNVNFTGGGLDIDTTNGTGFTATGSGTYSVTGTGNSITATGSGAAVNLSAVTVGGTGLTFDSTSAAGSANNVKIASVTGGAIALGSGSLTGATSAAFLVGDGLGGATTGGTSVISYSGTITSTGAARAVDIEDRAPGAGNITLSGTISHASGNGTTIFLDQNAAGTITFSGANSVANSGTQDAIRLTGNTGATINFTGGGLNIDTTSGTGFLATGGGTVSVTGSGNVIDATTGTGLNIANTSIASGNVTFQHISSGGGANNGITLDNTGTAAGNGGLHVTGAGSAATGGTIANKTGADGSTTSGIGIYLNSTKDVQLDRMQLNDLQNFGIRGTTVAGFTLANSTVNGTNGNFDAAGTSNDEGSISFVGLTGTASVTNTAVSGGFVNNVAVSNSSGTLGLTYTNVNIGANSLGSGDNGITNDLTGTAVVNVTVTGSTFTSSRGDLFDFNGNTSVGGSSVTFTGNTLSNNHAGIATGGGGITLSGGAVGTTTFDIENNSFRDAVGNAVTIAKSLGPGNVVLDSTSLLNVIFKNNTVGVAAVANSGSKEGSGISVAHFGGGTLNLDLIGNQIRQYNNFGISLQAGGGITQSGTYVAEVTGNTLSNPGNNAAVSSIFQGFAFNSGVTPGDSFVTYLTLGGDGAQENNFLNSGRNGGVDMRIRARQNTDVHLTANDATGAVPAAPNATYHYTGGTTDTSAVATFLAQHNIGSQAHAAFDTGEFRGDSPPAPFSLMAAPGGVEATSVPEWRLVGIGDFNGDGVADVLSLRNDGLLRIDTFNSAGEATNWYIPGQLEAGWQIVGIGDANGDGTSDILLVNSNGAYQANLIQNNAVAATVDLELVDGMLQAVVPAAPDAPPADTTPSEPPAIDPPPAEPSAQAAPGTVETHLTQAELDGIVQTAIARWEATGLTAEQDAYLHSVSFSVSDMAGLYLGSALPGRITIDADAAGYGWYVDANPADDAEFANVLGATRLQTDPSGLPAGHIDLLSTVMHELGHQLGLEDTYALADRDGLMFGYIVTGERRLPGEHEADGATPGSIATEEFAVGPVSLGTLPAGRTVTITFDATVNPQTNQFIVNPSNQGTVTSSFPSINTNTNVTTVDSLALGDVVFNDVNGNSVFESNLGETGIDGVTLRLYADTNNSGGLDAGDAQLATTTTVAGGLYSFIGLAPGNYIVAVESTNFNVGGALAGFPNSSPGNPDPDNNTDNDDNGGTVGVAGVSVASLAITLDYNTEPTNGTGNDTNNTLDFGFFNVPPNNAPTVTSVTPGTFTESGAGGGPAVVVDSGLLVDDDGDTIDSATVTITDFVAGDVLSFTPGSGITGGFVGNVLTLTGTATDLEYQAVLRTVTYKSTSDNPNVFGTDTARTISWTVNDGTQDSVATTTTVAITAQNDAPDVASAGSLAGVPNTAINVTGISFSDADSNLAEIATFSAPSGTFAAVSGGGVTVGGTASALTLTGTTADLNTYISGNNLTYTTATSQTILVTLNDQGNTGSGGPQTDSVNVSVVVNALPVLDLDAGDGTPPNGFTTKFTEDDTSNSHLIGSGSVLISGSVSITDADVGDNIVRATIDLTNPQIGFDLLSYNGSVAGITLDPSSTDTHIILVGSASRADYQAAIETITFENSSQNPDTSNRIINVTVNDGVSDSNVAVATVEVVGVNDAPINTVPGSQAVDEETNLSITGISVADADANPATQDLTVTLHVGSGTLDIRTDVVGGITAGDVTGDTTGNIVVTATLNEINATLAAANGLIYQGAANFNGDDTLTVTTNDNGHTGTDPDLIDPVGLTPDTSSERDVDTVTITVNPVNDEPTLSATAVNPTFTEGGAAADIFTTPIVANTVDAGQTFTSMTLTVTNVTDGTSEILSFDGSNVILSNGNSVVGTANNNLTVGVVVAGNVATVSFSGASLSAAALQTLVDGLSYSNISEDPTDANRVVTITQLVDSGSNVSPNDNTTTLSIASTVNVDPVNDEPSLTATAQNPTYAEGTAAADLYSSVTATNAEAAQTFASMTLTVSNVTDGSSEIIRIDGSDVALTNGNVVATATNGLTVNVSVTGTTATVSFSGATLTAVQLQTLVDGLGYRNSSEVPTDADRVVTITQLVDSGSNVSPNDSTATLSIASTVNVNPVNDAPVFGPGVSPFGDTPTFVENGPAVVLDSDASNTVSDLELAATGNYNGATLIVSRVSPGTPLFEDIFGASGSLTFTEVDVEIGGIAIGSYTQQEGILEIILNANATGARVNDVLRQLTYLNTNDAPPASVDIGFTLIDGNNGSQGSGGALSGFAHIVVSITPTNDPPLLFNVAQTAAYQPGTAGTALSPSLAVSDPDGPPAAPATSLIAGATVAISAGFVAGDVLSVDPAALSATGITASYNPGTHVLTLSGTKTVTDYQQVLDTVTYSSTSADPGNGGATPTRTIQWQATDTLGAASTVTPETTTLVHFAFAPNVDLDGSAAGNGFATTFTENGTPIPVADTDISITDADSTELTFAVVKLTNAFAGDSLAVSGALPSGIFATVDTSIPGEITVSLNGTASLASYQAAIRQVVYANSSDNPNATARDIIVFASDDELISNTAHTTVTVVAVNDAPVLAGVPSTASYRPHRPAVTLATAALSLSDLDNATLASATVHISAGTFAGDGDVLAVGAGGLTGTAISASYNAATETLTLSGVDTLAHYEQALEHVTFESTSINPTNAGLNKTRTVEWQVNDGSAAHNLSAIGTTTINIVNPPLFDFNGDGRGDFLWQNGDGTPAVWLMNGTGVLEFGGALPNPTGDTRTGITWKEIDAGDFDGDGKSDILWQNNDGTPAVWLMNGTHVSLMGPGLSNPGPAWHAKEAADFNGDGKADILFQNDNGAAAVWLMDGVNLVSTSPPLPNPGPAWHVMDAADFNGDGKADILWQNDNGTPAVWLMDGLNVLSTGPALANPGPAWHEIAAADFNGDGKADILWQNNDGTPAVWLMDGTGILSEGPALANPGAGWHAKEAVDTNGDGMADIVWQHDNGTPAVWLMNGTAVSSFGPQLPDPGASWHLI
jgi:hypothetical protein